MIRVYRYALRAPLDWGRDCEAEIERMRALWARLVKIEGEHQYAYAKTLERDSDLGRLNAAIAAAEAAKDWPTLKAARAEAKTCAARERKAKKAELDALERQRRDAVTAARQQSGCYWGNYNALIQSYDTARQRVVARGHNLYPQMHAVRITVQIQKGMSVRDLLGGDHTQLAVLNSRALDPKPDWRTLRMVVHNSSGLRQVHWPMIMHRPIPEDATIVGAQVTRRLRRTLSDDAAGDWAVSITVREPTRTRAAHQGAAGAAFCWLRTNEGLVAAIVHDGRGDRAITLPNKLLALQDRIEALTSAIDTRLNAARALMAGLDPRPPAADVALSSGDRLTIGALSRAMESWGGEPPEQLMQIARANRRDRLERDGLNRRMPLWRRELYRIAARAVARGAAVLAVADVDWAAATRALRWSGDDAARRLRRIAAPGECEAELRRAVGAAGGRVEAVAPAALARCHACGADAASEDEDADCAACGAAWDGAGNRARLLFAAAVASAAAARDAPPALAGGKSVAYEGRHARAKRMAAEKKKAIENGVRTT